MQVIYRLRDDQPLLTSFQSRAQERPSASDLKYGLRGSAEWWASIDSGALKTLTVRGVVRGLWLGQWYCGPAQFEMELADGSLFGGLCCVEPEVASEVFKLGRLAEVDLVTVDAYTLNGELRQIDDWLELRLGDMSPNPVSPLPHSEENFGRFSKMRQQKKIIAPEVSSVPPDSVSLSDGNKNWLVSLRLILAQWVKKLG
jgi:hypothetical protein